jgi:hypothetical protein
MPVKEPAVTRDLAECTVLSLFQIDARKQFRVRLVRVAGRDLLDLRLWHFVNDRWEPGAGLRLPSEHLSDVRQALQGAARSLAGEDARPPEPESTLNWERVRRLARQVARAREKLESIRPEDYRRPQDYRRVRTVRLLELRRGERLLRAAEAELRQSEAA